MWVFWLELHHANVGECECEWCLTHIKWKVLRLNPLGTRKISTDSMAHNCIESHLGVGFYRVPCGFTCNTFHLICVKHSLTFAHFGGWLAASFTEIQATGFQWCSQCDCAMQLWAMLSVDIWLCGCVMQFESKYPHFTLAHHRVSSSLVVRHTSQPSYKSYFSYLFYRIL